MDRLVCVKDHCQLWGKSSMAINKKILSRALRSLKGSFLQTGAHLRLKFDFKTSKVKKGRRSGPELGGYQSFVTNRTV